MTVMNMMIMKKKLDKESVVRLKNKLDKLRKIKNLTQEDLAKELRVSRQTISAIENGKYNPSLDLAFEIALYFNLQIEEVFTYEYEKDGINEKK